jgi:hypothetical protein
MKRFFTLLLITICTLLGALHANAQDVDCENDTTAPNATCITGLVFEIDPTEGVAVVWTTDIDQGSWDDCSDVTLSLSNTQATSPTTDQSLSFQVPGNYIVVLWVTDESGNFSACWADVIIQEAQDCDNDVTPPVAICDDILLVSIGGEGSTKISAENIDEGSWDNCEIDIVEIRRNQFDEDNNTCGSGFSAWGPDVDLFCCDVGEQILIELRVTDTSGNTNTCFVSVTPEDDIFPTCILPPNTTVSCADLPDNFDPFDIGLLEDLFGEVTATDNCEASVILLPPIADIDACGTGQLIRRFRAEDIHGNITPNTCQQVIAITNSTISFTEQTFCSYDNINCDAEVNYPFEVESCTSDELTITVFYDANADGNIDENLTETGSFDFELTGAYPNYTIGGQYPIGCHTFEVQIENGCGNIHTQAMPFCIEDCKAPAPICINGLAVELMPVDTDGDGIPDDGQITIWASDLIASPIQDCTGPVTYSINRDGEPNNIDSSSILLTTEDTTGTLIVQIWAYDGAGNSDFCETYILVGSTLLDNKHVTGVAFLDTNGNCEQDNDENALLEGEVQLIPYINGQADLNQAMIMITQDNGSYDFLINVDLIETADSFELKIVDIVNPDQTCPISYMIPAEDFDDVLSLNYNFGINLQEGCSLMQLDIGAPFLRRCFESYYVINYCNYGAETAEEAYVEVTLDDFINYTSSTLPFSTIDGNTYTFELGDIAPGECSFFNIFIEVSCDALLGQAHCSEALIYPNAPCDGPYTGAVIEVEGICNEAEEEVEFTIRNVGTENMATASDYLVVEDVIMYMEEPFILDSDQFIKLTYPANGSTYRLEAEQPEEYPWLGLVSATVEACGTDEEGNVSLGFTTQLPAFEAGPFYAIDCQENIGAYDPNDKQAHPKGVGEEHLIRENVSIDYKIRFQNTGTDTAFTVVVLDTLSEWLDASSVRPGASSHPYTFQLKEGGLIEFRFDNIMLPDSNINVDASNGFVQFAVDQLPDNPHGTLIENSAAIYFDFNEPVITNTVFHTVGEVYTTVSTEEEIVSYESAVVIPNPFHDNAILMMPANTRGGMLTIYASDGKMIHRNQFISNQALIGSTALPRSGLYFYECKVRSGKIYRGKFVLD